MINLNHIGVNRIRLRRLLAAAVAAVAVGTGAVAQQADMPPAIIHARIDTAAVTMGARTALRVEVAKNGHAGTMVGLPEIKEGGFAEFAGAELRGLTVDSTDLGNGRIQVNYNFDLQPFDPGVLTLPPFRYATPGGDTAVSEQLTLKVLEVEMPKEMRDSLWINPMAGTVTIPARWYDYIPSYWPWILIGLAVVAIIVAVILLYRKNGPQLIARRRVVPPYQLAMERLRKLKGSKLAESGHAKEYYTELTDILRQYLEGRFGIYAREMTSTQILDAMHDNAETDPFTDQVREMLRTADFVKFAKQQPLPDENVRAFAVVDDFVNRTKPVEQPEEEKKQSRKAGRLPRNNKKKNKKK